MWNLKKWSAVYAGALFTMLTVGCGNISKLAAEQDAANTEADQEASSDDSTTGGSLALSSSDEADASVTKIRVKVQTSLECEEGGQGRRGHKDGHDRRPPPPPPRQGEHGKGHGGMPPPPRDRDEQGQSEDQDFKLSDEVSEEGSFDVNTESGEEQGQDMRTGDRPAECVVAEAEADFEAGKALQLDGIAVGTYYVLVVLENADGKAVQQGQVQVEIKAGEVASAEIALEPVPEGSVSITIKQASDEEVTTDEAAESDAATDDTTTDEAAPADESTEEAAT